MSTIPAADPGFGVYVHWPFCAAKCPYCDFNSHVRHQPPDEPHFAAALEREIAGTAARAPGRTVASIFLGGGTPSLMAPATVARVLDAVAAHWSLAADVEVTLEANPSSVEAERFAGYRAAGVNRLSLGVQSLDDTELKMLGRLHDRRQALDAIAIARRTFPRVSFDLIYARPHQTVAAWRRELGEALRLAAGHLSLYQLTVEDGTPFAALHRAGRLDVPDAAHAAALYETTLAMTAEAGLPAYEISNHAAPGEESRHNLVYWRYGDYAGVGPGAHGRLRLADGRHATVAEPLPEAWLAAVEQRDSGLIADEVLTAEEEGDELLLMGLRLAEGIDPRRYERLSGRVLDRRRVADLIGHDLVHEGADGRLRATPRGFLVLDAVVADLAA